MWCARVFFFFDISFASARFVFASRFFNRFGFDLTGWSLYAQWFSFGDRRSKCIHPFGRVRVWKYAFHIIAWSMWHFVCHSRHFYHPLHLIPIRTLTHTSILLFVRVCFVAGEREWRETKWRKNKNSIKIDKFHKRHIWPKRNNHAQTISDIYTDAAWAFNSKTRHMYWIA